MLTFFVKSKPLPHHVCMGAGEGTVLLLCGFQTDLNCWRWVQTRLAQSFTTISMNNRGYGKSEFADTPLLIEDMVEDALALLEARSSGPVYIAGHSMGAAIAQGIARKAPEIVRRLALCNAFRHLGDRRTAQLEQWARQLAGGGDAVQVRKQLLEETFSHSALHQAAAHIIALDQSRRGAMADVGLRRQLEALAAFDSRIWFSEITTPLLIVHSREDRNVLVHEALQMAARQPGCATLTLPGGHASMVEQPRRLAEGLAQFFSAN